MEIFRTWSRDSFFFFFLFLRKNNNKLSKDLQKEKSLGDSLGIL